MAQQRVIGRKSRMVEVAGRIGLHADAPHDALGRQVGVGGEGQDLGRVQVGQAPGQGGGGGLGGQPLAPDLGDQPPAISTPAPTGRSPSGMGCRPQKPMIWSSAFRATPQRP